MFDVATRAFSKSANRRWCSRTTSPRDMIPMNMPAVPLILRMSLAARTTWPRDEGSKEDLVGSVDGHPSAKSGFWSWKGFIEMIKASNRVVQYIVSKVCGATRRLGQ